MTTTYLDDEERGLPPFEPVKTVVMFCPFENEERTFQVFEAEPSPGVTVTKSVCETCGEEIEE